MQFYLGSKCVPHWLMYWNKNLLKQKDMKTSLHKAAESGMYDVCKELLKAGSDVEALDVVSFSY